MVIKKDTQKPITKNIGRIFRRHNIIEYKPPGDYLNIDDFYKVYGYACFYKADSVKVNMIKIEELTITFVCYKYPRKLLSHLKRHGFMIMRMEDGIYYINGLKIPIQLILTSELSQEENLWLRGLTKEKLLDEYGKHKQDKRYKSIMNLIVKANKSVFEEEDKDMCEALEEIVMERMKDKFEECERLGLQQGMEKGMQQGIEKGSERVNQLIRILLKESRNEDIEKAVTDMNYQEQLFQQYGL